MKGGAVRIGCVPTSLDQPVRPGWASGLARAGAVMTLQVAIAGKPAPTGMGGWILPHRVTASARLTGAKDTYSLELTY